MGIASFLEAVRKHGRYLYTDRRQVKHERARDYKVKNPEKVRESQRKTRAKHREVQRTYQRKYTAEHLPEHTARSRKRQAARLQRLPGWLTAADHAAIRALYAEAARLTKKTGTMFHVDHLYPLQGKNVSGLHVPPNLRVLPATLNLQKHNKHPDSLK